MDGTCPSAVYDTLRDVGQLHILTAPNRKQSIGEAPCVVAIEGRERQALLEVQHDGLDVGTMMKHREHVRIPHQPPDGRKVNGLIDLIRIFESCPTLADVFEQDEAVHRCTVIDFGLRESLTSRQPNDFERTR